VGVFQRLSSSVRASALSWKKNFFSWDGAFGSAINRGLKGTCPINIETLKILTGGLSYKSYRRKSGGIQRPSAEKWQKE